jgi:sugar lactone lactonase YvrE
MNQPAVSRSTIVRKAPAVRLFQLTFAVACLLLLGVTPMLRAQAQFDGVASVAPITGETLGGLAHAASDGAGNLYIADPDNNRVLQVTVGGTASELISAGTLINGTPLNAPGGIAVDATGKIYIVDSNNNRIIAMMPGGTPAVVYSGGMGGAVPNSIAIDNQGAMYIAYGGANGILKVQGGSTTTIKPALPFVLNNPQGVAVDGVGNVYVADFGSSDVLEIGGTTTVLSTGSIVLGTPSSVTADSTGNIYISDYSNSQVVEVTFGGVASVVKTGGLTLNNPVGVSFDGQGRIYISDQGHGRVVEIGASAVNFGSVAVGSTPGVSITLPFTIGSSSTVGSVTVATEGSAGTDFSIPARTCTSSFTGGDCTVQVTFAPTKIGLRRGNLTLLDSLSNPLVSVPLSGTGTGPMVAFTPGTITTVAGNGNYGFPSPGSAPALGAEFEGLRGIAVDGAGDFFVNDLLVQAIRKVTPAGWISTVAGGNYTTPITNPNEGDGGPALGATFSNNYGVALDGGGNIYVADTGSNKVREVTVSNGIVNTFAGYFDPWYGRPPYSGDNGPATSAALTQPYDVAVDGAGNVYIADYQNNVIRKVSPNGGIVTVAGNFGLGYGFGGDDGPAVLAQLEGPAGLALDGSGNLYIADSMNSVIRMVTPAGVISTVAGNHAAGAGYSGDNGPATSAQLDYPMGVTVDGAGNLYIADYGNSSIRMVTPSGTITTVAGVGPCATPYVVGACYTGDNGPATKATLDRPYGIAAQQNGNLFFTDVENNVVRKVDVSDPPSLSFGTVAVGSTSAQQDVSIVNLGNAPLAISQVSVSANFSLGSDTTCPQSGAFVLDSEQSCVLGIQFAPAQWGIFSGSVVIGDNSLNNSADQETIKMSGNSPAPKPIVSLSQTSLAFGNQNVNTSSAAKQVTLTNSGNATLTFSGALTGANASSFTKWSNCTGPLAPGASCTINVQFKPTAIGAASAALTFTDNAANSPQSVTLSGTGLGAAVSLSQTSLTFPGQNLNTTSAAQQVTLTNSGNTTLTFSGALTGVNVAAFSKWSNCTGPLAAGASCIINVVFKPTSVGAASAALTFTDNASNSPQSVTLLGTGLGAAVSLSQTILTFASQNVNTGSAAKQVTLTNTGNATLSFSGALTGANAAAFSKWSNCTGPLAPGAFCTISVQFKPTAIGLASAALTFTDSASNSPQSVTLSGTGQ